MIGWERVVFFIIRVASSHVLAKYESIKNCISSGCYNVPVLKPRPILSFIICLVFFYNKVFS